MTARGFLALTLCFAASMTAAADDIAVTLFDVDGHETSGPLRSISHDSVTVDGESASRRWSDIVWLRMNAETPPHEPRGAAIWMANGDRLVARAGSIENEQLRAIWQRFPEWPELSLPLEAVQGLSLSLPYACERRDEIAAWLFGRTETRDELRLLNGDMLSGELIGWQQGMITFKSGREMNLSSAEVRDVAFNPELIALSQSKEQCWLLSLNDGSYLTLLASKSRIDGNVLKAAHLCGVTWEIPLDAIFEWRVLHSRTVYLSDLKPLSTEHVPFLPGSRGWPLQRDRSATGGSLRLGGREFAKGLGMHSRSTATYDLAGQYRFFHAIVGLDETTIGKGTASCVVEIDGRHVFEEQTLSRQKGAMKLPLINVSNAKRLTLTVNFGELGDSQDQVDWADAVLLK